VSTYREPVPAAQAAAAGLVTTAQLTAAIDAIPANEWEFRPEDYGAVGDNSTDDTAAINLCIAAAVAWATGASGNYYCEIVFSPGKTYVVSSATTKGGAGQGNAQIPLPAIATTGKKLTLVLRGGKGSDTFAHWEQTVGQVAGATIRTTLTGLSADGTWGAPSVVGGPTAGDFSGGNAFSNLRIVVDGVNVVAPFDPGIIAWDFLKCAHTHVINAGAFGNAGPAGSPALTTIPTNTLGMGLRASQNLNNAECFVGVFSCEGFYYGVQMGEHFTALRINCIYVNTGLLTGVGGGIYHGGTIQYACVEQCVDAVASLGNNAGTWPLAIDYLDTEMTTNVINDPFNNYTGQIYWSDTTGSGLPVVTGATRLRLYSMNPSGNPGAKTAPSVPATTVAHTNAFWRDCVVTVTGGTVTAIAVDGQTTGLTSGTVIVPTGKTITLTYSDAPTWKWWAL